jgi:hypothetical protein
VPAPTATSVSSRRRPPRSLSGVDLLGGAVRAGMERRKVDARRRPRERAARRGVGTTSFPVVSQCREAMVTIKGGG